MKYRPEVDGLRAFAVMPVILFHAGVPHMTGGFIGVDVFFVISGFLITTILAQEIDSGRYSLLRFYERRARRILPALVVVIAACLPFAWMWMLADQLRDFGQSAIATALFSSNILFWMEAGYFDFGNHFKPLIHTWSLAIEEQFYIFFPPLLALIWGFGRKAVLLLITCIGLVSLGVAQYWSFASPDAAFYLLPSRAWELMAGSAAAFWMLWRAPASNDLIALVGVICLLGTYLFFSEQVPHPSLWTVIPVTGTVLIIVFARSGTIIAKILSSGPFVAIGLVSYSAYLWHQPLFAFARIRTIGDPSLGLMIALSLLSLILAAVSWKYVEAPFRTARGQPSRLLPERSKLFAASGLVLSMILVCGAFFFVADGVPNRVPAIVSKLANANLDRNPLRGVCLQMAETPAGYILPGAPECSTEGKSEAPLAVILGDSHADAIAPKMREVLESAGWRVTQLTASDCPPAAGLHAGAKDCNDVLLKNMQYLESHPPELILTGARFQNIFSNAFFDNGEGGHEYVWKRPLVRFEEKEINPTILAESDSIVEASISDAYSRLVATGAKIVIVYPIPEAGWNVPQIAAKIAFFKDDRAPTITTNRAVYEQRAKGAIAILDSLKHQNIFRIHPSDLLCDQSRCLNAENGVIYYYDDDHLSMTGAEMIAKEFSRLLPKIYPAASEASPSASVQR